MRLLQYDEDGKLSVTADSIREDAIPPYAILSHSQPAAAVVIPRQQRLVARLVRCGLPGFRSSYEVAVGMDRRNSKERAGVQPGDAAAAQLLTRRSIVVEETTGYATHPAVTKGWADEVRIQLHLSMTLQDNGTITIDWTGQLYEGNSENTDDLEQTKNGSFDVRKNESRDFAPHLDNHGTGSRDTGDIALTLWNNTKP
ncbi:hypothetical protein DM02DRAFT_732800 [Periconia macrospinosa]|uniref:Uncharacterized protein n=1 Tax=Periconia macrospinosa TaxID=97972 RepID=A0A2V1D783_9PLEO|nr:hypothetical protein DM02DRAFT_732800 [Periconia macrospinosa]